MSQALHIFRKDMQRGWPLLLLWAALLLTWLALNWADPLEADKLIQPVTLNLVIVLGGLIGVSLLVHEEPLVGTNAFWMSRPIEPGSLLAAKGAFILLFLALPPLVCQLALLGRFGMLPQQAGAALLEAGLLWLALLAAGLAIAALTPSTPAYVAASLGAWLAFVVGAGIVQSISGSAERSAEDLFWGTLGSCVLVVPIALGVAANQCFTRNTARSIAFGVAGLAATAIPLPFSGAAIQQRIEGAAAQQTVQVDLVPGSRGEARHFAAVSSGPGARNPVEFWAISRPRDLPAGHDLQLIDLRGRIEWRDEASTPFTSADSWFARSGIQAGARGREWFGGRGVIRTGHSVDVHGPARFRDYLGRSGRVSTRSPARLWRIEPAARLPLEPGARASGPGWADQLTSVEQGEERLRVEVRLRRVQTRIWPGEAPKLVLANAARGELVASRTENWRHGYELGALLGGPHIRVRESVDEFPLSFRRYGEEPLIIDDGWLRDAELLFLHYAPAGRTTASVEIADLTLVESRTSAPPVVSDLR